MEENVFPSQTVAWELTNSFVEARLHTDGKQNIERIRELQLELAGVQATPYYVILDPETGTKLRVQEKPTLNPDAFRAFLRGTRSGELEVARP